MTSDDIAAVYEGSRAAAIRILMDRNIPRDTAEDSVQDAVTYFLERAATYTRLTPSLFIQKSILCALNRVALTKGAGSAARRYEVSVGTSDDLADVLARADDFGPPAAAA